MPGQIFILGPDIQDYSLFIQALRHGDEIRPDIAFRGFFRHCRRRHCCLAALLLAVLLVHLIPFIGIPLGQPAIEVGPVGTGGTELAGLRARCGYHGQDAQRKNANQTE